MFPNVANGQQQSHNGSKHAGIEDLLGAHQVVELEGETDQDAGSPQEQKGEGGFRKVHGARYVLAALSTHRVHTALEGCC